MKLSPIEPKTPDLRPREELGAPNARGLSGDADLHEQKAGLRLFTTLERALLKDMKDMGDREDAIEMAEIERGIDSTDGKVRRLAIRVLAARIKRLERRRQGALDRSTRLLVERIRKEEPQQPTTAAPPMSVESVSADHTDEDLVKLRALAYGHKKNPPSARDDGQRGKNDDDHRPDIDL